MKCWYVFVEIERMGGQVRSARSRLLSYTEARELVVYHQLRGRKVRMRRDERALEVVRAQLAAGGRPQNNQRGKLGRRPPPELSPAPTLRMRGAA